MAWKLDEVEDPFEMFTAVIDGDTISYTLIDGDGLIDGNASDPVAPGQFQGVVVVPTLDSWGMFLLSLTTLLLGWGVLRVRRGY